MDARTNVSTGSPWEGKVGYSRAVRKGQHVFVAGTTASDEAGTAVSANDAYAQTTFILRKIEHALQQCGATMSDVVRTRMFVTKIDQWADIGRAHQEWFGDIMPAATMVEVNALVNPDLIVEIEVDAVVDVEPAN